MKNLGPQDFSVGICLDVNESGSSMKTGFCDCQPGTKRPLIETLAEKTRFTMFQSFHCATQNLDFIAFQAKTLRMKLNGLTP